ncbi:CD244 protein, partial [Aramus guarauna]|nr:CD244 protein [Aramus guarauna]
SALGPPKCQEQAVSVGGTLQLQPEKPPREWTRLEWRVTLDGGDQQWILMADNKTVQYSEASVSRGAVFQEETLSLQIHLLSPADNGVYRAQFEGTSGTLIHQCFRVLVWEPVGQPRLEARILHREQGWCNVSLLCIVPDAGNVSYEWSCPGDPPAALGHQPQLQLRVHEDANRTVCGCNVSNPVSWSTDSTDVVAACFPAASGVFSFIPWLAVGLALAVSVALFVICCWWMKRGKKPPGGHDEQTLTVYEEVGKAQTGRDPNGTSEAMVEGNTIYAVVSTKMQGPRCPPDSERCTVYSTVQPTRMVRFPRCSHSAPQASSLKRKRLDPALVSTAYVEVT